MAMPSGISAAAMCADHRPDVLRRLGVKTGNRLLNGCPSRFDLAWRSRNAPRTTLFFRIAQHLRLM
jgi:hypothetical protein